MSQSGDDRSLWRRAKAHPYVVLTVGIVVLVLVTFLTKLGLAIARLFSNASP